MKKILLVSNKVMHYRSRIYNRFYDLFLEYGYEFHVMSNEFQPVDCEIRYKQHLRSLNYRSAIQLVRELNPSVCITFLGLSEKVIFRFAGWCRLHSVPVIYWGHGMNLRHTSSLMWRGVAYVLHTLFNALIVYSPAQISLINPLCRKRTFVAQNALDFSDVNRAAMRSPEEVKAFYGIKEQQLVLFIARIIPRKRIDILFRLFQNEPDVALVVVGGGASPEQQKLMQETPNFYYLGEKYGTDVDEIYQLKGVFCTPGQTGLALNQAMYWGKPVLVIVSPSHGPELCNLHYGENGFIEKTEEALKERIMQLLTDDALYQRFSDAARQTYEKEMSVERMFEGFIQAVHHVLPEQK